MKALPLNQSISNPRPNHRWTRKSLFGLLSLVVMLALLLSPLGQVGPAEAAAYNYLNNVSGQLPDGSSTQTGCAYWPATRYFLVDDYFTVNDLNVEFSQSHDNRGQVQVKLTAPDGTTKILLATSADTWNNYYITIDDASTNAINDGSDDTIGGTRRLVGPSTNGDLDAFNGKSAHGHWTMTICDNTYTGTVTQNFNEARLVFDGTAYTPTPFQNKQGDAVVETYFVPWPEDQVWTAMGRIFNQTGCSSLWSSFASYDGNPRQPMVGYTSITIVDAGTKITYDQWEDGYEAAITFPSQSTTQVWGDGDLLNGVAPGDAAHDSPNPADDLLAAGQVITLNDVMLSTTLGTIVDYDARDKIASSKSIAVSRSVWSDGSQTLFAAADEVYPTDRWGTEFRAPVGDDASLNSMFEYSGASIMAATAGTVVEIDLAGDGTYETTVNLGMGGTYLIDDNTNGLDRGGRIRSNAGHPIQVNQITADVCAGFESRTFPLIPLADWSSSYYSPVGTILDNSGAGSDDAPTTISLYNPGTSAISVCYDFATGSTNSVTVAADGGTNVTMNDLTGAHFYACTPGGTTTNDVEDQFGSQSYSNNNGSVNWATSWDETGDNDSATSGSIYISSGQLRFYTGASGNVTDTIDRQSFDLTGYTSATLSFTHYHNTSTTMESGDVLGVWVSDNGGSNWTQIGTIAGNASSGTFSQDISDYIASNTMVRFRINAWSGDTNSNEYIYVDNVNITFSYTTQATPTSSPFYAVGSVDSDDTESTSGNDRNDTYDWGITLVPEKVMSQSLIVGWAPGDDPTFLGTATQNTAPIWLTGGHPTGSTQTGTYDVCVDYNGDGGATQDPITQKYYDRKVTGIAPRALVKIYKGKVVPPDSGSGTAGEDQTGTQIWVCGPSTPGPGDLASDVVITAAWGEDPLYSSPGKPGLDMGYTIRNSRTWRATKGATLQVDVNGNGLYDEGDTIRYTVTVANASASTIGTLTVTDDLPTNATYVTNSTYLTNDGSAPPASGQIPDSVSGTAFPLDGTGYAYTNLDAFKTFVITWDMTINPGASEDPGTVYNVAHVSDGTTTLNPDVTVPVVAPRLGAIGNYVWLDEDGDGDQDAGEAGIPNVKVELCADTACTTVLQTTYTDANGGYVFPDLTRGNYYVKTYPPVNLNQTFDESGALDNLASVTLNPGEEHMTADFGYNWSTTNETNTPASGSTGAIGDRIWSDADGDGLQDAEEVGIQGVSVQLTNLGADGILGTPDDTTSTTSTDANGNYIFDGLSAGSYVVTVLTPPVGYNQTGDPDHFGTTGTNDNTTTTPIVLGPGDVFVNADFGYVRSTALVGSIGDTIWFDADADGVGPTGAPGGSDTSEYGIAGVTVALIKDLDGDGAWDVGEPIIATDITNDSGQYLFSGLPANGTEDYLVWVNDTNNVLGELVPTYDNNGTATPNISAVANLTTGGNLNQDFGYAPDNHTNGEGLIGDFVWLDKDGDGVQDAGEPGLEGVTVKLFSSTGTLLAVTVTDENGHYTFGDLPVSAGGTTYQVQVLAASLPGGLTQTGDPDAVKDNTSTVSLTTAAPVNLNQDFGYQGTNIISGTLWKDTDADGTLEGGESGRFDGVTVVLRDASGDVVATTTTSGGGNFSFTNLPNGTFTVDVTDDANLLNGYWKSNGPSAGSDNNSQVDPYSVTVTGGQTNNTADFGYYLQPAALGNFIWEDLDGDGVQDAGEPGIPNVPVTLTIAYPGAGTTTLVTTTDASGAYSFGNLLLDEDYALADVNSGTVTLTVSASVPGYLPTVENLTGNNDQVDYDSDGASEIATVLKGETDITYDFGFVRPSSIGNYVWLDEDGDGDQDAGEAGIPNALVQLCADASCTTVLQTTYTDANGGYLFTDLPRGTYYVKVTPPANLNQTYDENGALDNLASVTLGIGEEHLTADFGYNWSTTTETNNPGPTSDNTGAIGDRVWSDADGDGMQDAEEVGIQGVDVQLYTAGPDGLFGTGDDILFAARTTDATGNYIFDNLPSDAYVVKVVTATLPAGATQTGDPDHFGTTGTNDHQTTTPIVLAPGDVFVNADFGYQVTTDVSFIGDTVWFDADANGTYEPNGADGLPGTTADNEYGIAGVTVSLIKDLNNDGVWDAGEPIIATDTTDANGQYLFNGLPTYTSYLVWVDDTENVLGDLVPTYDSNGVNTPNVSAVFNLPTGGNLNQDFGYAPANHASGDGLIGDFVWLDKNGDGVQDAGEPGLEGVTVRLYDSFGTTLLAITTTDENGHYSFGNLPVSAGGVTYQVQVVSASLPAGLTQTGDPDAVKDSKSTVTLTSAAPVNLNQDFGYQGTNTIGGTIWTDANADGTLSGESGWFSGVTVVLKNSAGNIVATTTTDVNGNYSFTNLPNGTYTVDVTDAANVLNGYWKTTGPSAGSDNNSQVDPYTVSVSGGQTNTTADFGYYQQPAALGNLVWNDADNDGIQDAGEAPMAGITVTLTVTYPNGQTTTLTTTTDSNGLYFFGNLLQDEDFDGVGTAGVGGTEPQFKLTVAIPSGMIESLPNQGSNNAVDSDGILNGTNVEVVVGDVNNAAALLVKGWTNPDYDFGFLTTPTFTFMAEMPQAEGQDHAILVTWATSDETEVIYFNLYRTNTTVETRVLVYHVQAQNQEGAAYSFLDEDVALGLTYSYWLEAQLEDGSVVRLSPTSANSKTFIYLPVTAR